MATYCECERCPPGCQKCAAAYLDGLDELDRRAAESPATVGAVPADPNTRRRLRERATRSYSCTPSVR